MNRITQLLALAFIALATISCDKNDMTQPQEEQLEVNANNISGKWSLVEWNGNALDDATYVYIELLRNERTYTLYQNLDSFNDVPRVVTGSYSLYTDLEAGAIIRGNYDHDNGDWAHRYIIKSLTATRMTWAAMDDPYFVQEFARVESIPVK